MLYKKTVHYMKLETHVVFVVNSFKKKGFAQNYETRDKITVGSIYRTQHSS